MQPHETILPLENGDRLTRKEFERRYQAMPNLKKAELIDGMAGKLLDSDTRRSSCRQYNRTPELG